MADSIEPRFFWKVESNEAWCDRYVASIPPEALLSEIVSTMHFLRKQQAQHGHRWES